MAKCEVCGNDYALSFEVIAAGQRHIFDSFECAIHKLAPICEHCGCRVIGHGVEGGANSSAVRTARDMPASPRLAITFDQRGHADEAQ